MITAILGMKLAQVYQTFEAVDEQLEDKLQEVVAQTIEQVKQDPPQEDIENLFFQAHKIGLEAYNSLKSWSEITFTTSPEKELAKAWIHGCFYRFEGPRSIQKEIRQILSSKG